MPRLQLNSLTQQQFAGLVYKHFGREIVAAAMQRPQDNPDVEVRAAAGLSARQRVSHEDMNPAELLLRPAVWRQPPLVPGCCCTLPCAGCHVLIVPR